MRIISIHQPNYIPWLGYFYKIWASDIFILHDNVEFSKQSLTKRVYIREAIRSVEKKYLSVPLAKHSDYAKIKDIKICFQHSWQKKHINKIYNTYHRAPYFEHHNASIREVIASAHDFEYLATFNQALIREILKILDINTLLFQSSELPEFEEKGDALNAALVAYFSGTEYLSGVGAKKYQSESTYTSRGIDLKYNDIGSFLKEAPPQYPVPFDGSLSILDAVFYIGKKGIIDLFEAYYAYENNKIYIA
jgi:hypothetical protein